MKAGWQIKCLGDVTKVGAGNSAPQGEQLFKNGIYPFFRTSDAGRIRLGDIYESSDYLNEDGIKGLRLFPAGTILFPKSGASTFLNHRVMLGVDGYVSSHLATIVADNAKIHERFLFYFLTTISAQDLVQDHAYPSLNLPIISAIEVPLPPLPEQQRIVSILDEAFAGIATATANAEKNLANARELFASYLQSVFDNKGEGWESKTLGEIADVEYGYTDKSTEEGDYRYVRITDIDRNGELILNDKKYIKYSKEAKSFLINDNDLLMARTGATFAKVLLYRDFEPSVFASYLIRIKFKEKIENKLYWYFTKTQYYWEQANSLSSGAAQPHFNGAAVKQLIFAYPKSVKEQNILIEKFDALSAETKRLEAIYQQKLNALEELKKSILNQAFSGQLQ